METMQTQEELLQALNQFTRRTHSAEEVYIFDVLLCDNEIDRDFERFSDEALKTMQTLFIGKTGIFDHNPSGTNQTARIFATRLETHPEQKTSTGEDYTCLKGNAYMVRTDANQDLIREIDAGIKKEVSVSCAAASRTCSVCGKDRHTAACPHVQGEVYQGQLCHTILSDITDAYEWSFVAVPAQRQAGVTKQYGGAAETERVAVLQKQLQAQKAQLEAAEADIRQEIVRLCYLSGHPLQKSILQLTDGMDYEKLVPFRTQLREEVQKQGTSQLQRAEQAATEWESLQQFQLK
jgi:hypothetical protein